MSEIGPLSLNKFYLIIRMEKKYAPLTLHALNMLLLLIQ